MLNDRLRSALAAPDDQAPMSRAVAELLRDAAAAGVSDVHLNPGTEGLDVLYRIDGVLHRQALVEPSRAEQFLGKIKVLAGLLTYRRDVPQDGQIPAAESGGAGDIRVSIVPTVQGEKAVLRLFLHGERTLELDALGLPADTARALARAADRPEGVILLTGPSGSGKTTTIYSLLSRIARPKGSALRHVVTIEDPVERVLSGVTQTQINLPVGLTFAAALRSLLRQDPQVIMLGEIRDRETARVAMEAGLTGHLVISTIHAGTAAGVVVRLLEMDVDPHVLTSALSCVLAQRLVRRTCPECRGGGCPACLASGFRGRLMLSEFLEVGDPLRRAIRENPSRASLHAEAVKLGLRTLEEAGRALRAEGATTDEELQRVLG